MRMGETEAGRGRNRLQYEAQGLRTTVHWQLSFCFVVWAPGSSRKQGEARAGMRPSRVSWRILHLGVESWRHGKE